MSLVKTPTFSLTATELLANMIWYRGKTNLRKIFYGRTPGLSSQGLSQVSRLPQELVEIIISYLFYDIDALLACSMTCYSWYIFTLPHLHYYLTTDNKGNPERGTHWPIPLQRSSKLGLLPLVRQLCIRLNDCPFSKPKFTREFFSKTALHYFSALRNLQELGIDNLQVSTFMPDIQWYFGHLAPTLKLLALKEPKGSCRQILYFIGLFPNLQDLKLCYRSPIEEEDITNDATLVPLSIPPLHGRLILTCFAREMLVKDMITLFGGLRFRYMELFKVKCVKLLLDACAETLETLRLYPTDPYEDNEVVGSHFDLSQNRSLRTLETTAASIASAGDGDAASDFFKAVLSTVTSPLPLDVAIIYREPEVGQLGWDRPTMPVGPLSAAGEATIFRKHLNRFAVFREMYSVREFRLVLCVDACAQVEKQAMEILERIVEAERRRGGLDLFQRAPLIVSGRQKLRVRFCAVTVGSNAKGPIQANAL